MTRSASCHHMHGTQLFHLIYSSCDVRRTFKYIFFTPFNLTQCGGVGVGLKCMFALKKCETLFCFQILN